MNEIINQISDLEKQISDNLNLSKSKNTLKAYKSDFEDFVNFCEKYSFQSLPSNPKVVGLYLTDLSNQKKYSTLKRRLASINVIHKIKGYHIDCRHPLIRENLIGIKRKIGSYQKGKKPLLYSNLINKNIVHNNVQVIRDKSILLLGFSGGFRRSEIANLNIDDLEFVKEGLKIKLNFSKSDQFGEGYIKGIPTFEKTEICPVNALKKWINVRDNSKTSLFYCSDKTISLIVKKYASLIGLDPKLYSGHSLRSGFATSTASMGADERSIMQMTGHKSSEMVRRYIKEANIFKNNALDKIKFEN
jgi:site-specific recombinase XerD